MWALFLCIRILLSVWSGLTFASILVSVRGFYLLKKNNIKEKLNIKLYSKLECFYINFFFKDNNTFFVGRHCIIVYVQWKSLPHIKKSNFDFYAHSQWLYVSICAFSLFVQFIGFALMSCSAARIKKKKTQNNCHRCAPHTIIIHIHLNGYSPPHRPSRRDMKINKFSR